MVSHDAKCTQTVFFVTFFNIFRVFSTRTAHGNLFSLRIRSISFWGDVASVGRTDFRSVPI